MVTHRQIEILEAILSSKFMLSLQDIMNLTHKSERTIQYDLSHLRAVLKQHDLEIRTNANRDFYIPINQQVKAESVLLELKKDVKASDPQVEKARLMDEMILMLASSKVTSMNDLIEHLFMSDRLISDYLNELDSSLSPELSIKTLRNQGYCFVGEELAIRKMMVSALRNFLQDGLDSSLIYELLPSFLKNKISSQTIIQIDQNYRNQNLNYHVWLTNDMFHGLFNYLLAYELRKPLTQGEMSGVQKPHNQNTVDYILGLLNIKVVDENPFEVENLKSVLLDLGIVIKDEAFDHPDLDKLMGEIELLVKELSIQFNESGLYHDLKLHFQTLMYRKEDVVLNEIHLIKEIAERYPQYYHYAQAIGALFEKYFKELSEHEMSYIAIYLYKHRIEPLAQKRVIVVCATGKGLSTLLVTRIQHVFPQLKVVSTMSYYQVERLDASYSADFVITTMPLKQTTLPTIQISNVLSSKDIRKVHEFIINHYENVSINRSMLSLMHQDHALDQLPNREEMHYYSQVISSAILDMIELAADIQSDYEVTVEDILGLTIHIVLAISRWYDDDYQSPEFEESLLIELEEKHPNLERRMSAFFSQIEDTLMVVIESSERYAIYQYILKREDR